MTLLSLCQKVAANTPVKKPTIIVGSTEDTSRLLLSCANKAGESLARAKTGGWTAMQKEYTFSTVAAQADYDLPADFQRMIDNTLWDRSNYWNLRGPLSPQQWQMYKSSVLGSSDVAWKRFRIRDVSGTVKFSIDPTPTAIESLVFEYVSNAWCESAGGTGQTEWLADTDVPVLDAYLIELGTTWRFLKRLGMEYADERDEYDRELSLAIANDGAAPILSLNNPVKRRLIDANNVPDTGIGL